MGFLKNIFDPGKTVEDLSLKTGISKDILIKFSSNLPKEYNYNSFNIPKKNGKDTRIINAPCAELKKIQKTIYKKLLKNIKIHPAANGFVSKKSILDNAKDHVRKQAVINIDLDNFFHSIKSKKIYNYFNKITWDRNTSNIITNICCYRENLPQGAPTSPVLSNLVNYKFDTRLANLTEKFGATYTRYADDLTFSFTKFNKNNRNFLNLISNIIQDEGYKIQKKKKVRIQRQHQRQTVTGLVVNQKVNLPRNTRRKIRAMEHYYSQGKLNSEQIKKLEGNQSLLKMFHK